jgi:two-component system response regulator FlrC
MKSLERTHILEALAAVNGSRKLAAQRLGMSERTLRYKMQQYREENAASAQQQDD